MRHILFLTQLYPYPLADGASLRTFYVLKYLASRGAPGYAGLVYPLIAGGRA